MAQLQEQSGQLTLLVTNLSAQVAALQSGQAGGTTAQQTSATKKASQMSKVKQQVQTLNARVAASSQLAPLIGAGLGVSSTPALAVNISRGQAKVESTTTNSTAVSSGYCAKQKRKKQHTKPAIEPQQPPQDKLEPAHWSVPQRVSVKELTVASAGVAHGSLEEVREALDHSRKWLNHSCAPRTLREQQSA